MADRAGWMIYGSNGFTGHLVAVEAKRQGLYPVLAGRRAGAEDLGLPARVFDLGDAGGCSGPRGYGSVVPLRRPVLSHQRADDRSL
jgi:short subunit dehydrogenase-like uncharacterized protein